MKKLLSVLLVLLVVGGMAFGAGEGTLTLNSDVAGVLKHGFVGTLIENPNFGAINSGLTGTNQSFVYATDIDFYVDATIETLGYYYFVANTPKTGYTVKFIVNPFSSATADFEVPYGLVVTKLIAHENVTVTEGTISATGDLGDDISPSAETTVLATASGAVGPKYAGLKLGLTMATANNLAYGIPAATNYVATVVAYVTTN